ncbi:peptidylprolyl isomerase [Paraferrimonas sp. SM1919]|uniref:FKBP-type peptidyl-prolyl cis-trans isomerase n=1 Tax=Paraferrimonas sp. SM1919 TaxID=2662263 RepID=UPI0013D2171F|nr:peptidylprolyl isomerase [Paraferrimonas sp. SM1919]
MQITEKDVVVMHYSVATEGTQLDSTFHDKPLTVMMNSGYLVPGLDKALMGKEAGEKFTVDIDCSDAYGERNQELMQAVPISMFDGMEVKAGMQFRADTDHGEQSVMILDVSDDEVIVDGNHPLAGMDLTFTIEVLEVRAATAEELVHGHAHEDGKCSHH